MQLSNKDLLDVVVKNVKVESEQDYYQPVTLTTNRGDIRCRYYPVEKAHLGAIWVGGVGGDWDTPGIGLYPEICRELTTENIASLRIHFRYPTQLEEAVFDVLAGVNYLQDQGIEYIALIGHSFGGAVVIRVGALVSAVRTVVTLATQAYGTDVVSKLATRCSLLLIHGEDDPVLSPVCSEHVYDRALEPKQIITYPGATHRLDEVAAEVHQVVREWVVKHLNRVVS